MKWAIQNGFFSEYGYGRFIDAVQRLGLDYTLVTPTSDGRLLDDRGSVVEFPPGASVFPMGSYTLARIGQQRGWMPGAQLAGLDYSSWSVGWGSERLLNPNARVVPLSAADFESETAFVRPSEDSKVFSGKVFERGEWRGWKARLLSDGSSHERLGPTTPVVISQPRTIYSETRCWVVDDVIVSTSGYRRGREVIYTEGADPEVVEFARTAIQAWVPNRAFVLDIAQTPDGCKIIEANCLNSAGFYACDTVRLAIAIEEAFAREHG